MTDKETDAGYTDDLLRRVEEIAGNMATGIPKNPEALSPEQVQPLLHRLHAHQTELTMLNSGLRRAQKELEQLVTALTGDLRPANEKPRMEIPRHRQAEEGCVGGRGVIVGITERKEAKEAQRQAEENFRRSLDESPLGVRIVTVEGETIYANRAVLDIYHYGSIEELKATPVKQRYTPESYAQYLIRREKRQKGMDVPNEYAVSIIRKGGEIRHLQVFRKEIFWDGERQYQTIYIDITGRKQAEEALVAKSRQLEEANTALRILMKQMKEEQREIETKITTNIQKLVLPNLEELRGLRLNDLQANCLEIAAANLQQIISPFLQNLAVCFAEFTPGEIRVANMIRQGRTSKEIADILNTSIRNIEFHRGNIRKKLGLKNHRKASLRITLLKLSEG
jgi:PAS domain S-box-containing protein